MKPKEYIEREALLDEINIAPVSMSICMNVDECKGRIYERERLVRTINDAPAADVVEVRYCRFSLEEARRRESVYKCSACGNYLTVRANTLNGGRGDMNYCPFCGRKVMHKGQDNG